MKVQALQDVVPAVFADEASAAAALDELRQLGYSDNDFGILVPDPTRYHIMDKSLADTMKGLGTGGLIGAPLGMIAGMGVVTMIIPPLGFIGIGGALIFGGLEGALWGAYVGAQIGLAAEIKHIEDIERRFEVPLQPHEILIIVVANRQAPRICELMERHGARCFWEAEPKPASVV